MRKSITYISLTGGLGNQLFQLAAAVYESNGGKIIALSEFGKPRLASNGEPEIQQFTLPKSVSFASYKSRNLLISKALGYVLRIHIKGNQLELNRGYRFLIRSVASISVSLKFRKWINIVVCRGVGYSNLRKFSSQLLVGYFQSYRWAFDTSVYQQMMKIDCAHAATELSSLRAIADVNPPLIVHIRLKDYRHEPDFGIPSTEYYSQAIEESQEKNNSKEIWVFSDEIENCKVFIPPKFHPKTRWIEIVDNSDSATLEAMRLGSSYVIGNSTFGYWGALLSKKNPTSITVPFPWFKAMPEPTNLIPDHWIRLNARYDLNG